MRCLAVGALPRQRRDGLLMRVPTPSELILAHLDRTKTFILLVTVLDEVAQLIDSLIVKAVPDDAAALVHVEGSLALELLLLPIQAVDGSGGVLVARRRVVYRNTSLRTAVALERLDPSVLIGARARMRTLVLLD